ncbi:hypothetical protein ROT00_06095 [Agromyces mediolanus]|uniref:hypothetical protein n=1 Tax=Agromyces mediolanus TaxID=41986 RepID=UPI00383427DE
MTSPELASDATTDAPAGTAPAEASASPFTMLPGAPGAMVCEGDVCFVPGTTPAE